MDLAIPVLPSRSLDATVEFYEGLGFAVAHRQDHPAAYAIVRRGTVEIHFFGHSDLDPKKNSAGCYIRVEDADGLHARFTSLNLPKAGIPRLTGIEDKPWGMREFAIVDPDGNLVRVGQIL